MTAVIFTYPPDYLAAALAVRYLRKTGVSVVLAVDESDPRVEIEGAAIVRTKFRRNGNLNGMETVIGQLETLLACCDGSEYILKVDSDSLVMGLGWLEGRIETVVGLRANDGKHRRSLYGFCYAVREDALPAMLAHARSMPHDEGCHEDITTGIIAAKVGQLFTYRHQDRGVRLGAYCWMDKGSIERWKELYEVLCFQREMPMPNGRLTNRRDVSNAMRRFIQSEHHLSAAHP